MDKITLYLYSKCSTCQKALRFIGGTPKKDFIIIKEIVGTPPTIPELKRMLRFQNGNLKKLFNTSGMLYRELQLTEKLKDMPQEEALQLLTQNGMLVKRPFLLGPDFGLTGFKQADWERVIDKVN